MKKIGAYLLFIYFLPLSIFGQKGYIVIDRSQSIGLKLIDGGNDINSRICKVKTGNDTIEYTPFDIKEYKLKNGQVFLSKDIQLSGSTEKVFLERLYNGETTLYYLKRKGIKTFFLEKDSSSLIELPRRNENGIIFNKQLLDYAQDCSNVAEAAKLASYSKESLIKFAARYNKCELKPFPHFRYGINVGYEFIKLASSPKNENELINQLDFASEGALILGFFIDHPLFANNFSIHPEVNYSKHGYSYNVRSGNKIIDFVANVSSLKIPFLIRYTYPSNNLRPYVNIGTIVSLNIKNENVLYQTNVSGNVLEINEIQEGSLVKNFQIGFSFGGGIEYKLNYRNSLFFDLRFSKLFEQEGIINQSIINLSSGINF